MADLRTEAVGVTQFSDMARSIDVDGEAMGGALKGGGGPSEARALREMRQNGMEAPQVGAPGGVTFGQMFRDSVDKVNTFQVQADTSIKDMVAGRSKNLHETMLTVERADTSLKLLMQVRNKLLDAYREIMRMQV